MNRKTLILAASVFTIISSAFLHSSQAHAADEPVISPGVLAIDPGNTIYFGNIGSYPFPSGVIEKSTEDFGSEGMLLQSSRALERGIFDTGNSAWENSSIRRYLNSSFYYGNFSEVERDIIRKSVRSGPSSTDGSGNFTELTGDYIFLPSEAETNNSVYGKRMSINRKNLKLSEEVVPCMLRDSDGTNVFTKDGDEAGYADMNDLVYLAPAFVIDTSRILFTTIASNNRPMEYQAVEKAPGGRYYLTLQGGSGFDAVINDDDMVFVPGDNIRINITATGSTMPGVKYTRTSAMLINESGEAVLYGPVNDKAATGEVYAKLPDDIPTGTYHLWVFAEDVNSSYRLNSTDYASNIVDCEVNVVTAQVETAEIPETEKSDETQTSGGTEKKTESKTVEANTHSVKVYDDGHGVISASAGSATSGTLISLSASPKAGYHLKYYDTKDVRIASNGTFTMPDGDVSITGVFEADAVPHKIKLGIQGMGTLQSSAAEAMPDTTVMLYASPAEGYVFSKWISEGISLGNQNQFRMPDTDVSVTAVFEKVSDSRKNVNIRIEGKGKAWVTDYFGNIVNSFNFGDMVKVYWYADDGYVLNNLRADSITFQTLTDTGNQSFYMPDREVNITFVFAEKNRDPHEVTLSVSGEGSAWTTDADGNSKLTFKQGDTVYVHYYSENGIELKSVTGNYVDPVKKDTWYEFVMPDKSVNVSVKFKDPEIRYYPVKLYITGNGSGWIDGSDDPFYYKAKVGEEIHIYLFSNTASLESIDSSGVSLRKESRDDYWFDMPSNSVQIYADFETKHYSYVGVSTSGNGKAWTENEYGEKQSEFGTGEIVIIRYKTKEDHCDAYAEPYGNIEDEGSCFTMTMPDNDTNVWVSFWSDNSDDDYDIYDFMDWVGEDD